MILNSDPTPEKFSFIDSEKMIVQYESEKDLPDPIDQWSLTDLELTADSVGLAGSPTRVAALQPVKRHRKCRMLAGEPQVQVENLMERLTHIGAIGS